MRKLMYFPALWYCEEPHCLSVGRFSDYGDNNVPLLVSWH